MDRAQEDKRFEALVGLFIARCDSSKLFEIAEEILDEMRPAIRGEVTGMRSLRSALGGMTA